MLGMALIITIIPSMKLNGIDIPNSHLIDLPYVEALEAIKKW
jgi:hypothetical protein